MAPERFSEWGGQKKIFAPPGGGKNFFCPPHWGGQKFFWPPGGGKIVFLPSKTNFFGPPTGANFLSSIVRIHFFALCAKKCNLEYNGKISRQAQKIFSFKYIKICD